MTYTVLGRCQRTGRPGIGIATFSITVGLYCNGVAANTGVTISQDEFVARLERGA